MATQRTIEEADIRRRMEGWCEAIRAMDLDGVTSSYARDIASFDVGPLRHAGAQAKRNNWVGVRDVPASARLRDSRPYDHRGR